MVAKCSNPACNREFRELSKGRLFLLPPTRRYYSNVDGTVDKLSDYCFWLCPECDQTHTITRCGSDIVVAQRAAGVSCSETISVSRTPGKKTGLVGVQSQSQAG